MQRFMLNLRQLGKTDSTETSSDAQHSSHFSIDFRAPSDFLGNLGESLNHSQSEWLHEDALGECSVAANEPEAGPCTDLEGDGPVVGPSGARWVDERVDDASHGPGYMNGADTRIDDFIEEVRLSNCSPCCAPD